MWEEIRKFSLKYTNLPTMISNVNLLLRCLTLNVDSRLKSPIPLPFYLVTATCAACYYYAYLLSTIWFVFWRSPQTGNLTAAMVMTSLGVCSQIATVKLFYMLVNGSKVRSLVDRCLESDALSEPDSRFSRSMRKVLRIVNMRAISFWICIMVNAALYVSIPIFLPGKHLPEDLVVFYGLEPTFETPYFEISYAIMIFCVLFIAYTASATSAFNIIIIGYTEAQMISLSQEILCLWEDSIEDAIQFKIEHSALSENKVPIIDDKTKIKINLGVKRRLVQILQNHSRNVALLQYVDEFFNVPNAIAFAYLGISLIVELLGGLENTYLQISFTFVQVAMDCFTGQRIMDASVVFESAVYSCNWEKFDKDNQKIVLLMLQNSQKTLTVSAGGMAVLNFSCLMSIVRSVYSAYTTFKSMINK